MSSGIAVSDQPDQAEERGDVPRGADRRRDRFLATIFHELRTPLTTARTGLFILSHATPGGEQARRALRMLDRQFALLVRLVDDLLDVSRLQEGKIRIERTRLDLADLARRTLEDHEPAFVASGLELRADIPSEPVWVEGDAGRLAQVIANLLHNAEKFTPRGGQVALALDADESAGAACLRLRDTGLGFDPTLRDALFEPFEQAEATLPHSDGGLGLGLALVRGLVELHGGKVEGRSDGPGAGAEFVVHLPLHPACAERS